MKSEARVVVIGGGVVGCSVLYHLTKGGWKDVVLVERDQLTSGSTWHAAGGFHTLNGDPNVAKLQGYTIGLYDELERISGQSCGLHRTGGLLLADTPQRMNSRKRAHGAARYRGLQTERLTPKEAKKRLPLIEERYFVGAMLDAADGNLDPSGTTHAYAKSARIGGAEIYLQTRVTALERRADGTWKVITDKGTIHAEHVVNCGGLWAREIGRMVGLELPVLAMEHMYLVTDEMPEVVEFNRTHGHELPHAIDFKAEIYMRQERSGMLLGTYEKACVPWQPRQTPWDFGNELLPPALERDAPLHQRQGPRELCAALLDPLSERGAAGRASAANHRSLRSHARAGRRDGRQLGTRGAAVVRAPGRRAAGRGLVPPLERLRTREGRVSRRPQRRRRDRDRQFREVRARRRRRGGLSVAPDDQPHAARGETGADPDVERGRQADRRLHDRDRRRRTRLRPRAVRHARTPVAAPGEEFSDLVPGAAPDLRPLRGGSRALRRSLEERLHRPRGGVAGERERREAAPRHFRGRCNRCRRGRR